MFHINCPRCNRLRCKWRLHCTWSSMRYVAPTVCFALRKVLWRRKLRCVTVLACSFASQNVFVGAFGTALAPNALQNSVGATCNVRRRCRQTFVDNLQLNENTTQSLASYRPIGRYGSKSDFMTWKYMENYPMRSFCGSLSRSIGRERRSRYLWISLNPY